MYLDTQPQGQPELDRENERKSLKLSEAIRIGARLRPRANGYLFMEGKSCALGAAYEAMGYKPIEYDSSAAYHDQYVTLQKLFGEKVCGDVWHLNDDGWSREQIANWLEAKGL